MKRILALVALAVFVAIGITASFKTYNPFIGRGAMLPQRMGVWSEPFERANPFGVLAPPRAEASAVPGYRWVFHDLMWRTNRDGGIVDSTIVTVSNTDFSSDTTASFELSNIPFPHSYRQGVATTVDTVTTFAFYIGSSASAASIDSVYVGTQVSMDGVSWVTCTVTGGPAGTFLADAFVTGKPPIASAGVIESGSSNQLGYAYNVIIPAIPVMVPGLNGTAPTDQQILGWRYVRWICTWSLVDEADVLKAWVGYPAPPSR